jgi:hypothetical protein
MDWRLQPREGETLVTCEATFTVPGGPVATLLNPVVRAYNQRELDATLDRLRDLLEAG